MYVMSSPYLGRRGYTIYKDSLTVTEEAYIRRELTVQPVVQGSPVQGNAFPVYRESHSRFYLPKFFGLQNFPIPCRSDLPLGDNIEVKFEGNLREYQKSIAWTFMKSIQSSRHVGGGVISVPCGRGKTVIALDILAQLKKKTLVVVHKGFLVSQWTERIQQFLPQARVGCIQGQTVDIDNKDIVIGMLQSLSMKDYPQGMFDSFGFMIVDECHHISSEVFSRSLVKIMVPYTLGLSATVERKDGLTKVFKMFLGDIVYEEEREANSQVRVRAVRYSSNDPAYAEEPRDHRGKIAHSSLISNICSYSPRTVAITDTFLHEMTLMADQQVLVLAQQKNILSEIAGILKSRNFLSYGYYLGGMKESVLKSSEDKKVVLATYAMAAEALDIKTLTTLVLATPRTDVVQAVGRILRCPHTRPLIIDFVDEHSTFVRQWEKRCRYYNKNKYTIEERKCDDPVDSWVEVASAGRRKRSPRKPPSDPMRGSCHVPFER